MTQITLPDADLAAALDGVSTDHFFTEEQFQRNGNGTANDLPFLPIRPEPYHKSGSTVSRTDANG